MMNWQSIEELKDIFIEKYTESKLGSELEKACSEEYELKRDYNGRQILELLQNVDDAYVKSDKKVKDEVLVKIVFKDNILEVGNTGTSFSQETIERLCLGRASEKSSDHIGNKGTGFRSLLNDAEWIELHSGDFSIRFSEQYAKILFKQYTDDSLPTYSELIHMQVQDWKKDYELCFPIMNCPEAIEKFESEFDTLIRVKIKPENRNKETGILNQLKQPFYKSLLFLPNITKIEIAIDDEEIKEFEKDSYGKHVYIIESQTTLNEYYVEEKKNVLINGNKLANIIIAIPLCDDYDFEHENLYCYFPIREFKTPVHALIHAPFLTNNSRDNIPNDNEQINKRIFEESLKFLKEIAEHIINDHTITSTIPIKTVTPTNEFINKVWDENSFNLKSFYMQLLLDAKLLPTVNKEYISISDCPKSFNCVFLEEFKGNAFKELLVLLPNNIFNFIKKLSYFAKYYNLEYTTDELLDKINQISENIDIPLQIKFFIWWNKWCKTNLNDHSQKIPNLLKDANGEWIKNNRKIYLPTDTGVSILPASLSWVNLCILNQSYVDELINQLINSDEWIETRSKLKADNIGNKRILDKISDTYFLIQFTEQSNADLVIDEINKQIDTKEKAISFIQWFYKHYNDKLNENTTRFKINYILPDRDGNLKMADELFFGKEYGNDLAEKLFDKSKFSAISDCETLFNGLKYDQESIFSFLKNCGVSTYPKAFTKNLCDNPTFVAHIKSKYNYKTNINYLNSMYIEDFERNLEMLDTQEIVKWITEDIQLYNILVSKEKNGYFSHKSNSSKTPIYDNEYLLFILNKTKWIQLSNKKYAPNEIVKYPKLADKINGIYGISEHELIKILNKQFVNELQLGFINSLASFPDKIIRKILLELPKFDKGEISRSFYEDIIKSKQGTSPTYSTDGLQVLATDGKFYDNSIVKYTNTRLPKANNELNHFIQIPISRSTETIKNWLGVERYRMSLEKISEQTISDKDFEQEITDIKISALTTLDITENFIKKTRNLKIIPCTSIRVKDIEKDDFQFDLDDYNYIKTDGKYYIKLPADKEIEQIRGALYFRTSITEIFKDSISPQIEANKFAYLLLNDQQGKKDIIKNEYGIDKWNTIYELMFFKKSINNIIINFFEDNSLDIKMLQNIKKIDFSCDLSIEDFNILKGALLNIKKDIDDINRLNDIIEIDVKPCLKKAFSNHRDSKEKIYRYNCYIYAKKNSDAQSTFLDDINKFRCYKLDNKDIENSIYINFEAILKNNFSKFDPTSFKDDLCIDNVYTENYENILKKFKDNNLMQDDLDMYLNKYPNIKSMLYFHIPEKLLQDLNNAFVINNKTTEDSFTNENAIPIYKSEDIEIVETKLVSTSNDNGNNSQVKCEKSQKQYDETTAHKEKAGKKAEQIAYAKLKEKYPNLIWHSKNSSVHADKNKGPVDIVCDMWAVDSNNKKLYFEIKSATTEFEMSISEYKSMESAPNEYEVVLVNVATKQISMHKFDELKTLKQISKYKFYFTQINTK